MSGVLDHAPPETRRRGRVAATGPSVRDARAEVMPSFRNPAMRSAASRLGTGPGAGSESRVRPAMARSLLGFVVLAALTAGLAATSPDATSRAISGAGADLTRLLRFMAVLKSLMAAAAVAGVFWRLGAPATRPRLAAYALACGAMATGPGLIWAMAHVGAGALLLHGGLAATVLLLWRDPAVARRLSVIVAARAATRSFVAQASARAAATRPAKVPG